MESFEILAEVSIALLGFSGIAAVLGGSRAQTRFIAPRIQGLLWTAGIAALCSTAPLAGVDLTLCSILYVVLAICSQYWAITNLMRHPSANASWTIYTFALSGIVAAVGYLCYALIIEPSLLVSAYKYAIYVMMVIAGIFFVRMAITVSSADEAKA